MTNISQQKEAIQPSARTVAIVSNSDEALYRFWTPIIRALVDQGSSVAVIAPRGPYVSRLEEMGATFIPWKLSRGSLNPARELRSLTELWGLYRRLKPTIVQHFSIKPNVYGAIAGRLARVPVVIANVHGLGYVFSGTGIKRKMLRVLMAPLYRLTSLLSNTVTFMNSDDIQMLAGIHALSKTKARFMPGGVGIDVADFRPDAVDDAAKSSLRRSLGISSDATVVAMVSRMLWDKGVGEYVQCAEEIRLQQPELEFLLVGPVDHENRSAIPLSTLTGWQSAGAVRYLGHREDIRDILAVSDIVTLPSYYREGIPRILLEAAAMGKAIVTTDMPGCRDTVDHEVSGLLVPPKDSAALASAVGRLLASPDLRGRFGGAARDKAIECFDERKVVAGVLELHETLLTEKGVSEMAG